MVPRGDVETAQRAVSTVAGWTVKNNMQPNADKCKELIIDFTKNIHNYSPLMIEFEGNDLPVVTSAKILGVTISDNLKWNDHVLECIKKANKRLFFIVSLKRANVPVKDNLDFYCCSIRSVLEYCAPVYHHALPAYLSEELERVQKRITKILAPRLPYSEAFTIFGLTRLKDRRSNTCVKFFTDITNNPTPKRQRKFCLPRFKTDNTEDLYSSNVCNVIFCNVMLLHVLYLYLPIRIYIYCSTCVKSRNSVMRLQCDIFYLSIYLFGLDYFLSIILEFRII